MISFTDSDWVGCLNDMSTSGYVFSLGLSLCSWSTRKQSIVALSSVAAEYVTASRAVTQAVWLKKTLEDIGEKQEESTIVYFDNRSVNAISENLVSHDRRKHIAIKYHYI